MMENYDRTVELIDTAYDSAGRSSEQFAKYQDTAEYKLKQLSNTWEQLRTGFLNSDTYKGLIDFANKALDLISKMDLKQILTVGTIGLTLGKTIITQFVDGIKGNIGVLKASWNKSIEQIFDVDGKGFSRIKASFKKFASLTNFKNNAYSMTAKMDVGQFLGGANEILGGKIANAPELANKVEIQKIAQLQEQLSLYTQLEQKKQSIVAQAKKELETGNEITQQTREQSNAVYQETQEKSKYINNLLKELGYEKEITAENAKQIAQALEEKAQAATKKHSVIGQAGISSLESGLSAGITSALMMAISGADFSTVIKTASISALSAAIPSLISAVMPTIVSALVSPVGLVGIAVGAIALIGHEIDKYYKKLEENQRAVERIELNRLKNIEEANKNLQEEQLNSIKKIHSVQKEQQNIQDLQERYNILSNKVFLTESEQTELSDIIENLTNNYDELILSFDENTNEIQFNTVAIEKLNETLTNEEDYYKLTEKAASGQQIFGTKAATDTATNLANSISEKLKNYSIGSVQIGGLFDENFLSEGIYLTDRPSGPPVAGNSTVLDSFFAETNDEINLLIDSINSLDSRIKNEVGLDANKIYNAEDFQSWFFDESGYKTLEDFSSALQNASEQIFTDATNQKTLLNSITNSVKNSYQSYEIAGEQIGEELANDLTAGIVNVDSEKISKEYEKYNLGQGTTGLFTDIVEEDLAGIARRNVAGNITTNDIEDAFITMGFVNENYELDLESYKKNFATAKDFVDNIESLPKQYQDFLENNGYLEEIKNINVDTDDGRQKVKDIVEDSLQVYIASLNTDFANISEEVLTQNSEQVAAYNKLQEETPTLTRKEYETKLQAILSQISDNQLKFALETANTSDEATKEIINKNAKNYQEAIEKFRTLGVKEEEFSDLSLGAQTSILDIISNSNLSGQSQKDFTKNLVETYNNLKPATQNVLGSIDLINSSYSQLLISADEYIRGIAETGEYSIDEATKIYMDYIETASSYLTKVVLGEAGTQVLKDQYNDHLKSIKEDFSSLIEAQDEFVENGTLSSETYFQLLEDGFGNYVKITENGYELIADAAEKAFVDQAMVPLNSLRQQIDTNKKILNRYKKIGQTEFEFEGKYSGTKEFLDINEILQEVLEKDMSHFNRLDSEIQDYILAIKDAGYSTQEEFIKALEEGILAMENMEPDVWVQGLVSISEASVQAEEKAEDLKEELGNLNEQLEEDKEALNEAEDALRQAMHGSDDFQSSLDGLVNYTEKIERLDKAIEKTKESLEDVSNIDEAKGLLNQLNDQYKDKTVTIGAENLAIDAALSNLQSTLTQNYGDYISFDAEGNPLIDFAYMQMDANDEIRKAFEEEYNLYNEYRDKKEENLDKLEEIEKEREQQRKESLEKFVSIQENVISVLKEKAQEEIDATKEKYDALEEADNDYLDALQEAIDKQRELRDQQNKYEDLATKEKKLSLLQRDTSGANQKEVLSLQNEIEDDRQNLLDSEVDNLIESMKELYEKQKEARDAEIEYMEEVTDNAQYFADWASNIMSTWQSVEDMQAWYLENDPEAQDMTVEQTEVYLNQIKQDYSDYIQYIALSATDFATDQEELNAAINEMYENTSTNVENIGTTTQEIAQAAADKAIEEATKARDDARDKLEETQKKISETTDALHKAEDDAVAKHGAAMNAMVEASQSAIEKVSVFATQFLIESSGIDFNNKTDVEKWAKENNLATNTSEGVKYSQTLIDSMIEKGFDTSWMEAITKARYEVYAGDKNHSFLQQTFDNKTDADNAAKGYQNGYVVTKNVTYGAVTENKGKTAKEHWRIETPAADVLADGFSSQKEAKDYAHNKAIKGDSRYDVVYFNKYAQGGLVNYTGPAWVDGTPNKPEAFLNSEDTKRIGEAAKILADIPIFNSTSNAQNAVSTNIGDTSIEIHINVENISSDYDVDEMIDRVKQDIVDVSKPIGSPIILKK